MSATNRKRHTQEEETGAAVRRPVYAGSWYPSSRGEIEKYLLPAVNRRRVLAAVCPHAGWMYSGMVAGNVYSLIEPTPLYIMIGPNHTGLGEPVSVFPEGTWETPLGPLTVDREIAAAIIGKGAGSPDVLGHLNEHSLEVQTPFIKLLSPDARIVPVSLADYRPETCRKLGETIAEVLTATGRAGETTVIASTDMSHYVPADYAKTVDSLAIDSILRLDPENLLRTVSEHDITMCGSGPTAAALWAVLRLGARHAELVRYATSGDVTGDNDQVVAYAGMIVY